MNEWYIVNNLSEFVDRTRTLVFAHFGSELNEEVNEDALLAKLTREQQQELDEVLTHEESMVIAKTFVKKQVHKTTKAVRYTLSDEIFMELVASLNDRMVSNLLHSLVKKGLLESAYDSETNDFIFWTPKNDDNSTEQTKPETD